MKKDKIVCISGYFDPILICHIKYIQEASRLGRLWVILNTDEQAINKKGYIFMVRHERKEILKNIMGVEHVFDCIDKDKSVCKTLEIYKPDIFAKGGDRTRDNIPEYVLCQELDIDMIFGIGGSDKPQSSSWLVDNLMKQIKNNKELMRKYGIKNR